ncbi:hypothetical protein [Chondrinema litorale]|uniref:hypothetical protein n=1 Tax=Chondrinema litorale TaxID=2994555 RepID=UPI002542D245|nr:hypothetical protein [Chondrinema litorale]UZR96869.1 hypothetical protein OQ292_24540 [Chondrinema litorale]
MNKIIFLFFISITLHLTTFAQSKSDTTYITSYIKVAMGYDNEYYNLEDLVQPISYDYHCFSNVPDYYGRTPKEGILKLINVQDSIWSLEAIVIEECINIKNFFPKLEKHNDTLNINWLPIDDMMRTEIQYGDTILLVEEMPSYLIEECYCAYFSKLEFYADNLSAVVINGKNLNKTNNIFETYEIQYFLHKGDTIGYIDTYGRIQGTRFVRQTKTGYLTRDVYKNSFLERLEIYNSDGKLLFTEKDFSAFDARLKELEEQ